MDGDTLHSDQSQVNREELLRTIFVSVLVCFFKVGPRQELGLDSARVPTVVEPKRVDSYSGRFARILVEVFGFRASDQVLVSREVHVILFNDGPLEQPVWKLLSVGVRKGLAEFGAYASGNEEPTAPEMKKLSRNSGTFEASEFAARLRDRLQKSGIATHPAIYVRAVYPDLARVRQCPCTDPDAQRLDASTWPLVHWLRED